MASASGAGAPSRKSSTKSAATSVGVNTVTAPVRWVEDPVTGEALAHHDAGPESERDDELDVEVGTGQARCEQCDNVMAHDDIFCGECGFVSRAITKAFSAASFVGETRPIDLGLELGLSPGDGLRDEVDEDEVDEAEADGEADVDAHNAAAGEVAVQVEVEAETEPAPEPEPDFLVFPPAPRASSPKAQAPRSFMPPAPIRSVPSASSTPALRRVPTFLSDAEEDVEATRIVNRISGNRFVLQFSTGESVTVHGTGLIGRNPQPEPGEFFDQLVRVLDTGKSVSKTHLEFGQESGAFWVKDRFSGNGTILREPDVSARRAEAGRRYRVVRGTRIDIGEQFFVVS